MTTTGWYSLGVFVFAIWAVARNGDGYAVSMLIVGFLLGTIFGADLALWAGRRS